jgi:ribosomal protein L39E
MGNAHVENVDDFTQLRVGPAEGKAAQINSRAPDLVWISTTINKLYSKWLTFWRRNELLWGVPAGSDT